MTSFPKADLLKQLRSGTDVSNVFQAAREIEDSDNLRSGDDRELISIYQRCQHHGLNYHLYPQEFLDSCLRLSVLLFKYRRAHEAKNYLLILTNQPEQSVLPAWVWAYSAKLEYLGNISLCTQNPTLVLDWLEKSLQREPDNQQALSILSEFVMEACGYLKISRDKVTANKLKEKINHFCNKLNLGESNQTQTFITHLFNEPEILALLESPSSSLIKTRDQAKVSSNDNRLEPASTKSATESLEQKILGLKLKLEQVEEENLELQLKLALRESELHEVKLSLAENEVQSDFTLLDAEPIKSDPEFEKAIPLTDNTVELDVEQNTVVGSAAIPHRSHILVVGDSRTNENHLLGICKSYGIKPSQIEFHLDFNAFDKVDFKSLAYDPKIAGILIGPLPHKVPGCDDPANVLTTNDGFPPSLKVETSAGELKITKASFRSALEKLLVKISSGYDHGQLGVA